MDKKWSRKSIGKVFGGSKGECQPRLGFGLRSGLGWGWGWGWGVGGSRVVASRFG